VKKVIAMTGWTANLWHNFITISFHVSQEYIFLIAHRYLEILKVNINFDIASHILLPYFTYCYFTLYFYRYSLLWNELFKLATFELTVSHNKCFDFMSAMWVVSGIRTVVINLTKSMYVLIRQFLMLLSHHQHDGLNHDNVYIIIRKISV
jgi:hypothetical protein